jgi:hypothetical protein
MVNKARARVLLLEIQDRLKGAQKGNHLLWKVRSIIEFSRSYLPQTEERKCEAEIAKNAVDMVLANVATLKGEKTDFDMVADLYGFYHSLLSLIPLESKQIRQDIEGKIVSCLRTYHSLCPRNP